MPIISIVIPVRNDADGLERCLRAIAANDYPRSDYEIIVCDNGSSDDSVAVAERAGCRIFVEPHRRIGDLRNRAVARARGAMVAFIDADHEIAADWLRAATDALREIGVAAAGAQYEAPAPGTWVQRAADALRDRRPGRRAVDWLPTGNLAVWRNIFEYVGGFDTSLETCEDVDFCRRLRAAGYRLVADSRLRSRHAGDSPTLGRLFAAELWRGRDNIRVSLRRPWAFRTLVSAAVPLAQLALVAAAAAILAWPGVQAALVAAAAIAVAAAPSIARARRMSSAEAHSPFRDTVRVAFTYDAARALALVARVGHRRS